VKHWPRHAEHRKACVAIFRRSFPDVRLHIRGGLDGQLRDALRETPLDFLLTAISEVGEEPDLVCTPLLIDDYQVIAGSRHPLRKKSVVHLKDLLDYPWILPGPTAHMTLRLETMFRAAGLPPPDAIIETTELIQFKITLIRSAAAMNYLSLHEVRDLKAISPRGVTPLLVEGISWQRKAGIVTRRGIASNPPAVEFAKVVTRVCQSQPSWAGEAVTGSFWSS
jgi:DNA-binding transcriptional LysR family regulator